MTIQTIYLENNKKVINFAKDSGNHPETTKKTTKVMLRRMNITSYLKTRGLKHYGNDSFLPSFECSDRLWQAAFTFQLIADKPTDTVTT